MAESLESGASMVAAHAALTYAAEGHGAGGKMNNGVVDAASAKMAMPNTASFAASFRTVAFSKARFNIHNPQAIGIR